jgi:diguanylate cyclase (GGDEF)-like protein
MPDRADAVSPPPTRHVRRPATWKLALVAGFVTQLLLILFVTAIGLQQLGVTTNNLNTVVDVHMRKQDLTKTMVISARERTLIMFMLTKIEDPFERDELLQQFNRKGSEFVTARLALLKMPLNARERELIERQKELITVAQPIQEQVINLIGADFTQAAVDLVLKRAIPAQNNVMAVLTQLDSETQRVAGEASRKAHEAHRVARFWMYLLSSLALLVGLAVAAIVLYYTNRVSRERERLATHDTLTGLPNRMLFMDRLEQALARAKRRNTLVGVMFIDLDRFKRVNDTLGHACGDQLIREVAQRLRDAARAEDTVARLGGDEFVVVMNDATTINQILHVVEKIRAVVAAPCHVAGRELFCSSSIGISVYPHDGTDCTSLLKNADTAMYHAKGSGRDRFQLYDAGMNAMAEERLQLETDLHYALERHEFVFHYQPQVNLDSGRIQGVEALIRWNHPDKGVLAPAAFLEMLEETGEIVSVGRTLLLAACRQAAHWHAAGFKLEIAVNLSGKEFWHTSLIPSVRAALEQSGLPPRSLQLELTEGIFMEDIDSAVERIRELKALGVAIAVDDFGTGYSSLAHLKRFPLDVLKIDRYFIRDLPNAQLNRALVSSILALCDGLHLDAVAEGVEDPQQLECLRRLGCRIVQGYLFSQPVPAEQLTALLDQRWNREFAAA